MTVENESAVRFTHMYMKGELHTLTHTHTHTQMRVRHSRNTNQLDFTTCKKFTSFISDPTTETHPLLSDTSLKSAFISNMRKN